MFSVINKTYPFVVLAILAMFYYSHLSGEKILISRFLRKPEPTSLSQLSHSSKVPPLNKQREAMDVVYSKESSVSTIPKEIKIKKDEEKIEILSPLENASYEYPRNEVVIKWRGLDGERVLLSIRDALKDKVLEKTEVFGEEFRTRLPYPSKFQITLSKGEMKLSKIVYYRAPIAQFDSRFPFIMADVQGEKRFKVQYKTFLPLEFGVFKAYRDVELKTLIGEYPLNEKGQVFRAKKQGQYCFKVQSLIKNPYVLDTNPICFSLNWDSRPQVETAIAKVDPPKVKIKTKISKISPKRISRSIASVPKPQVIAAPIKPNLDQIMTYYKIEGRDTYQFKLPRSKEAQSYHVQLFRDPEGTKFYKELTVRGHRVNWRTDLDGKMYYRYRIIKDHGNYGEFSHIGALKFPISPYDI